MTADAMWAALLTPTGLFVACMVLIFGVLLPLLIWDESIKARHLYDDLAAANTRGDLESDEFRTSADEAIVQGNDHGRVWDRWSA